MVQNMDPQSGTSSGLPSGPHSGPPQKLMKTICKYLVELVISLSIENSTLSKMYSVINIFISHTHFHNLYLHHVHIYLPILPVFPGVSKFFIKFPSLPVRASNLPGNTYHGLFQNSLITFFLFSRCQKGK